MTKVPYFYSREAAQEPTPRRALPGDSLAKGPLFVAAGNVFTPEMRDYLSALPIEEILDDVCAPAERTRLRHTAQYFPSLYELLSDYAAEYPRVTVREHAIPRNGGTVAITAHCLFFCVGAVLRAADAALVPCTLSAEGDLEEISLCVTAPSAATSPEEVAAVFHLSERETEIMHALAAAAGFSIALRPGDEAAIDFTIPTRIPDRGSMAAPSDPSLYRAFFLPRMYFF